MRNAFLSIAWIVFLLPAIWEHDFDKAKQLAHEKHELILLNFSGSDWCIPCIKMKKDIFDDEQFTQMADTSLILVNADFPRSKKHQLSKEQAKQNDALAARYNPEGLFPLTLLLDENGNVLKTWQGLPHTGAAEFITEIKTIRDARR